MCRLKRIGPKFDLWGTSHWISQICKELVAVITKNTFLPGKPGGKVARLKV